MDYQCFIVSNPTFGPGVRLIESITNSSPAIVTTTSDHDYPDGTIVRFDIPPALGMEEINQMISPIEVIDDTSFYTDIDSTQFHAFSVPVGLGPKINICGLSVPIGSRNDTLAPAEINIL